MPRLLFYAWMCLLVLTVAPLHGAEITRFRGSTGVGSSDETGLPVTWSSTENIAWRTELPGPGTSSPITNKGRIYLTAYSGYGLEPNEGEMDDLLRHVICLDRKTGDVVWQKEFEPNLPESAYRRGTDSHHGYASSTPTTDGERIYVFFGKSGVYCLDLDGNQIWHANVGEQTRGWGSANSLVLFENLLIVNASIESNSLVALNKTTGQEAWRVGNIRSTWNTPLLVKTAEGESELVLSVAGRPGHIVGYDPATGDELWRCEGIPDSYVCPSVIANDGIVYAIGGRRNTAVAVRAGGRGDVTGSHRLWSVPKGSNVSSPVYHDGHIYWVHERDGIANCLDAKTGAVVYQERLAPRPGTIYSSTYVADGRLYVVSQDRGTYVLAAKPEFELLAHNVFADDESRTNASPVAHEGQLLLRNDRYLYCIGEE